MQFIDAHLVPHLPYLRSTLNAVAHWLLLLLPRPLPPLAQRRRLREPSAVVEHSEMPTIASSAARAAARPKAVCAMINHQAQVRELEWLPRAYVVCVLT